MEPTLYILMRTDIQDMNPGKAIAQGSHATSIFEQWMRMIHKSPGHHGDLISEYNQWREDRSFGRVITLEATLDQIQRVCLENPLSGTTIDPTYPWRNHYGQVFLSEEVTCGWAFICNCVDGPSETLKSLQLHR